MKLKKLGKTSALPHFLHTKLDNKERKDICIKFKLISLWCESDQHEIISVPNTIPLNSKVKTL